MHFSEDIPSGNFVLNSYAANSITINNQEYGRTIYLSPNKLIDDIPLRHSNQLDTESVQFIIDLKPELLLLGTGLRLNFPSAAIIARFAQFNIGFETMNHAAACRTYAVLAAEQRNVGGLFLIDG